MFSSSTGASTAAIFVRLGMGDNIVDGKKKKWLTEVHLCIYVALEIQTPPNFTWHLIGTLQSLRDLRTRSLRGGYCYVP